MHYDDHKKNYFETIKELFALSLNVVQYSLDGKEMEEVRHIKKLEQIEPVQYLIHK